MSKKTPDFVHLHCHSEFSLLDGAVGILDAKDRASAFMRGMAKAGHKAMALTDHGNLFGAIDFYRACREVGIKPIIGMEAYMAPQSRFDKERDVGEAAHHITLLAHDQAGYRNLVKLASIAYLEGFHYKPRIDKDVLMRHREGLIGLSGCLKGEIPSALLRGDAEKAVGLTETYLDIFGRDNFYFEVMRHGLADQETVLPRLAELGAKMDVPLVATNDAHYGRREDHLAHDALLCIGTGKKLGEEKRLRFDTQEFYYKTPGEMAALFADMPEAVRATAAIAERCSWKIDFDQLLLPRYDVPAGETPESFLRGLCLEGLKTRMGRIPAEYRTRLDGELAVIDRMGFAPYFLIVWDFIRFARERGIPVGPGRGSGAGSLVAYALFITSIDPITNGLLFERFLNPDRRSMPDLDIDFSDDGRDEVIQYVRRRYGENCVAQIITFGSMLARGVIRDVGRVLDVPLGEVERIAGMVPKELGITLDGAMATNAELKGAYQTNPDVRRLIDLAKGLEGLKRHTGVHAAGTLIAAGDITEFVPLAKNNKDIVTTQYDGETLAKMGLLKVDFLGLRTLTVIRDAVRLIRERHRPDFSIDDIPLDDPKTYALLARAEASGIFQLESSGMRDLLRKLKPASLSDITALISLYRPGPMGSGMLDEFVVRRSDPSRVKFDHPALEPILRETYGIIVYQEQVMKISQVLAGFTPGEADGLRKAMGKKIKEELEKQRDQFVRGAGERTIPSKVANAIFDQMAHFGGYGFNKSHASAYGLISYQTAYLKANYPVEYMAALCTNEIGHSTLASKEEGSKLVGYLGDCEDMGIAVLPPHVETSRAVFAVETPVGDPHPAIRFGLSAVKNVGEGSVVSIVAARETGGPFSSLSDFCARVDGRLVNSKVVESLIKAGAFDAVGDGEPQVGRPRLLAQVDAALGAGAKMRAAADFAKDSLFGEAEIASVIRVAPPPASSAKWSDNDVLAAEKEVLGLYLSGHPLKRYSGEIASYATCTLGRLPEAGIVRVAGHVLSVKRMTTKRGALMARFVLEDLESSLEVTVFPSLLTPEVNALLVTGAMVVVKGRIEMRENDRGGGGRGFLAEEILTFLAARERFVRALTVTLRREEVDDPVLLRLKEVFGRHPGPCRVNLAFRNGRAEETVLLETRAGVKPTEAFLQDLEKVLGSDCWRFGAAAAG